MNNRLVIILTLTIICSVMFIPSEMADAEKQDLTVLDVRYDSDSGYVVVVVDSEVDMMQFIVVIDGIVDPVAALGVKTETENWILIYHTATETPEHFILKNVDDVYSDISFTYPSQEPPGQSDEGNHVMIYVVVVLIVVMIIAVLAVRKFRA